jgi:hypothetical protein
MKRRKRNKNFFINNFRIPKDFEQHAVEEHFDIYKKKKDYINASLLKSCLEDPATAEYQYHESKEETPSMKIGSAVHAKILEPKLFKKEYIKQIVIEKKVADKSWNLKANAEHKKAQELKFLKRAKGRIILTASEWDKVHLMVKNAKKLELVKDLFTPGTYTPEKDYFFELDYPLDDDGKKKFKGKIRVDYEHNTLPIMLDVKTSKSVSLQGFRKEYGTYDYPLQMAYYYDGINKFREIKEIFILVLKNTAPYTAAIYRIPMSEIEYGRELYTAALNRVDISDRLGYAPGAEIGAGYDHHKNEIMDQGVMELNTYFKKDIIT